jgi:uncharacterized protein YndB with AHSA1/START domain
MSHDLRLERTFDAEPNVVFDAFLDPGGQRAMYADSPGWIVECELDLRVGGTWTIVFGPTRSDVFREEAVFTEVDRPRRLAYDLTGTFADGRSIQTQVEITFETFEGRTRMTLVQHGYPTVEMRDDFLSGWSDILSALGDVVIGWSGTS